VASLTFVTTTTGGADLPPPQLTGPSPAAPDFADLAAVTDHVVALMKTYSGGSPHFDEPTARALVEQDVARARDPGATLTNHYAMTFDGPVNGGFADITAPTLVVHGDRDPLFPVPHGEALRDAIPGAELLILNDTGHDVPRAVWDVFVAALVRHTS
jgi:pimeloyl-ACP methyl ester carboxylesterase